MRRRRRGADELCRAAAESAVAGDARIDDRRRLRKLDLCRRRDLRDRRVMRGAVHFRRGRARPAVSVCRRIGRRCGVGRGARLAIHSRSAGDRGARGNGHPLLVAPYEVFGDWMPQPLRRWLDLPAFWLVLLPIELPATYFAGSHRSWGHAARHDAPTGKARGRRSSFASPARGLVTSWLLVSTLGDNNDLGLRAIIPAEIILIVGAAAALTLTSRRFAITALAVGGPRAVSSGHRDHHP